jgi:predicted dehydrogenase
VSRRVLRAGLIGTGRIATEGHLPAYRANADLIRVVAVADPDAHCANRVGDLLGVPLARRHADAATLIEGAGLDLIVVASPPRAHYSAIVAALRHGLAVICEKPLCLDAGEIAGVRASTRPDGFVAVLHNYLDKPGWRQLISWVGHGRIGAPRMVRIEELSDDHWRLPNAPTESWRQRADDGGGPLRDNLYHAIYLVERLVGSPLADLSGQQAALVHPYPSGDSAAVVGRHHNGALSTATAAWSYGGAPRATAEVWGTDGVLRYQYWAGPGVIYLDRGGDSTALAVPGWSPQAESGYRDAFRTALERIRDGGPAPYGIDDAARVLDLLDLAVDVPTARPPT